MTDTAPPGRRERKKAATRKRISDVATRMFLDRGFDEVSIREIAEAADVSPTTVFAHFSQKEALVFDEEDEQRDRLVAAVRDRTPGATVSQAIHDYYAREASTNAAEHGDDVMRIFLDFLNRTPSLRDYAARMWLRHEGALADAIAAELGAGEPSAEVRVFARFVLQIQTMVNESDQPEKTLAAGFAVLENGWSAIERRVVDR
ncbi:TetR/AcrR family transcriptional regulator [Microbacterium sp. cf332]|uniref:TetR/AcrR family transcriptional regulator n=1 Tax=Microbacterium sp. cf332 TaxID=1761804 RepID=UPI000880CCD6|nr:TetR/AcrR family transcriptional regulator [Microbacterium sp. cf332]SDQ47821.1 transcriptional regulator, TetR family [Microbacterium sp. cf332]